MGFSRPSARWMFPDGAVRILAEPSNNSNLCAVRQLFAEIRRCQVANCTAGDASIAPRTTSELAMLGFLHDFCRRSHVFSFPPLLYHHNSISLGNYPQGQAQTSSSRGKDPRIGALIETLGKTKTPSSAAISPDGTTVAWALRGREGSQIHLTDVANPDPAKEKIIGTGTNATGCGSSEPKWSPDGEWLAFVSDCTAKAETARSRSGVCVVEEDGRVEAVDASGGNASTR